jgi:hypothetical protein
MRNNTYISAIREDVFINKFKPIVLKIGLSVYLNDNSIAPAGEVIEIEEGLVIVEFKDQICYEKFEEVFCGS